MYRKIYSHANSIRVMMMMMMMIKRFSSSLRYPERDPGTKRGKRN